MTCKSDTNHHTLSWKKFECDLCKHAFSYSFLIKGKIWSLVDLDVYKPKNESQSYIILESLNIIKNSSRVIHIVLADETKSKFSLGRGHESDLRINDISVSRLHAHLQYTDGFWRLVDCRSKFGTLALNQGNIDLQLDVPYTLQIGRTVITIYLKDIQPWMRGREEAGVAGAIKTSDLKQEFKSNIEGKPIMSYLPKDVINKL